MLSSYLYRAAWAAGPLLAATIVQAEAAGTCAGTMETSSLHPLPRPMVVTSARSISDSANPELARRFVGGLQQAGVSIGEAGNVTLSIAVSVSAPPNSSRIVSGQYQGLNWVSGEPLTAGQRVPGLQSTKLSMSAVLSDNTTSTQSWLATIDCQVQTDDPGALAEDLGVVIGRAIGTNIERRRI